MKLETKFEVGQEVWVLINGKVEKHRINSFNIMYNGYHDIDICYRLNNLHNKYVAWKSSA